MDHRSMRKTGLVGLLAILVFGLLVGYATARFVQIQSINISSNLTAKLLESIVNHQLTTTSTSINRINPQQLKAKLQAFPNLNNIISVRLWDSPQMDGGSFSDKSCLFW